ncbi:MAG TPA: cbb3-type cytochrome c oxidase subunit II [Chloroflexia bacterium]|nr:cbb3-type cytochrome c oxidase subunit II [Chloroflexia bacterium]
MTGKPVFRMDVPTIAFGGAIVFWSIIFVVVAVPYLTFRPPQSADARPLTAQEENGRRLYAGNGCQYCHSQYLRPQDWTGVASFRTVGRVAQAGDFYYLQSPLLGTERTGPDLSQEGGAHTDEWHLAHFRNPRFTYPKSIMPEFSFYYDDGDLPREEINDLVAYVQSLGGRAADDRTARQRSLKQKLLDERGRGNQDIIHEWFPTTWRNVRNPMEPTQRSLLHGKTVFLTNCIGCHGLQGDGKGPASRWVNNPAPRNFTDVSAQRLFSDGEMYDAILFGVDGTAMPAWGDQITVNDIWDVTNFLRTIPNGGINREPTADMMVSPPDYKPIELTPVTALLTPQPQQPGLGQTSPATPPAATGTPGP